MKQVFFFRYYVLTGGAHPYGAVRDREKNILDVKIECLIIFTHKLRFHLSLQIRIRERERERESERRIYRFRAVLCYPVAVGCLQSLPLQHIPAMFLLLPPPLPLLLPLLSPRLLPCLYVPLLQSARRCVGPRLWSCSRCPEREKREREREEREKREERKDEVCFFPFFCSPSFR